MKYALFTAIPFVGHLNPLLRQAEELQRRGWRVAVAATTEARPHILREHPGLPFVDLGGLGEVMDAVRRDFAAASRDARFMRGGMRVARGLAGTWPAMFRGLTAAVAVDRPDVMVIDAFTAAGICAADAAGIPTVINNPALLHMLPTTVLPARGDVPLAFSGKSIRSIGAAERAMAFVLRTWPGMVRLPNGQRRINRYRRRHGLDPVDVDARLRGRLILVDDAFGFEYRRPLPSGIEMVGPILPQTIPPVPPEMAAWLADGPPVAYANLGTIAEADARFLGRLVDAFNIDGMRILWVLRPPHTERLPSHLPASLRVVAWGPPPFAMLAHPNVKVFVSHCGPNSVHEAIYAGTPVVGIPMLADQSDVAARMADAGVGVWFDKHRFTPGELRAAIQRVADDDRFLAGMAAIQRAFRDAGGARRAADLIEQAAARGGAALPERV